MNQTYMADGSPDFWINCWHKNLDFGVPVTLKSVLNTWQS